MNPFLTCDWDNLLGGEWQGTPPQTVSGWSYDTRLLERGECFLALKTDRRDGHDFLQNAQDKGASAAWVEEWDPKISLPQYKVKNPLKALQQLAHAHRKNFRGKVLGVTGSCGKTSTKDLLHHLLNVQHTFATEGNFNNFLGLPLMILKLNPNQHRFGVFEIGISVPDEMDTLAEVLCPDIGIVTAIAPVHLEAMQNLETIAHEKSKLLRHLNFEGTAFMAASALDYSAFHDLSAPSVAVVKEGFGKDLKNAFEVCLYSIENQGGSKDHIKLKWRGETFDFEVRPLSVGMKGNVALSLAVALHLGEEPQALKERLQTWQPSSLRGEWVSVSAKQVYLDCYNASPVSMVDALQLFYKTAPVESPRLYIIGGMNELGADAAHYHERVGEELSLRPIDEVYVLGDYKANFLNGVTKRNPSSQNLHTSIDLSPLKQVFKDFKGSVFIKGSHSFRLWELLND